MKTQFDVLRKSRELILKEIEELSLEQLQTIPKGFVNNIAWNVAHVVVTQQLLLYKLSGLDCLCDDNLIENYKKGTTPSQTITKADFDEVKELLIGLPNTLEEDYEAGIFKDYTEYLTSTGFVLTSFESALAFNNFHEGVHYGIIRAIKKLVS